MKKHPSLRFRIGASVAAMCLCIGTVGMASCSEADDTVSGTVAPTEAVTLPAMTDDRVFTSTDGYAARVDEAFAEVEPVAETDLTYTATDAGVTVTGYTGEATVVVIPDTVDGKAVIGIAEGAFADKGSLTALSLPASVETVGAGALAGCDALTTLSTPIRSADGAPHFGSLFGAESHEINASEVPAKLRTLILTGDGEKRIPDYCFYDCPMEVVALPDGVTEIGAFAFYGCANLAYIPLAHTALAAIGERAFTGCTALLSLELPATVESVGFALLEGCGQLESLTLPFVGAGLVPKTEAAADKALDADTEEDERSLSTDHVGYLFGARAYMHTAGYLPASLIRVTLLAGCDEVPANAFFECSSIREIVLPEGVESIGRRAFYRCERLISMVIPDSVRSIGDDALHGCVRLSDLTVGAGVETLGVQVFMDCLSLKTVTLPATVTTLPNAAFAGCMSLEALTAPGVTTQGAEVFRHCDKLTGWTTESNAE